MEINFSKDKIEFEKNLSSLDNFVISFCSILNKLKIKHVLISGYVSILFGRSRTSEDVDMIIEKLDFARFKKLWDEVYKDFECINTENPKSAYEEYLLSESSIRFSKKKEFIPNMEIKFPQTELDNWSLENRKEVVLNNHLLFISPIELQISFKLFLGSEKDIEDARHLYRMFKENLDVNLLQDFNRKLKIEGLFNKYLR